MLCIYSLLPSGGDWMSCPSRYTWAKADHQSTFIQSQKHCSVPFPPSLSGADGMTCSSDILAGDVSDSSGSSWAAGKAPAGCLQFIQQPLPLMEYFTHLSKQINWVQTDVRGANRVATGQRILLPVASLCVCVCGLYVCVCHRPAMPTPS